MIIDYSFKNFKKSEPLCTEFDPWLITESTYRPDDNVRYESIFSQGNGYMGGRGYVEEGYSGDPHNTMIGTFIAGVYDNFRDRFVEIVNVPDFFKTDIYLGDEKFDPLRMKVENYRRIMNMKNGLLTRELEIVQSNGHRTRLCFRRFYSVAQTHFAGLRIELTPLNYSGSVKVESLINGEVANIKQNFWPPLKDIEYNYHLDILNKNNPKENRISLLTKTKTTKVEICTAADIQLNAEYESKLINHENSIGCAYQLNGKENQTIVIDKIISVFTSRDKIKSTVEAQALEALDAEGAAGFDGILEDSAKAWQEKWVTQDIEIEGNVKDQQAIRFNIFNLIQANKADDPTVNIGAKCLTHMRYHGYFFWDTDTFILPYFIYENPKAARNLIMFRYLTLDGARQNAREHWHEGAMYQMCAMDGRKQHENAWEYDDVEVHTSADISYAIWQYYQASGDEDFLVDYGAEILCETSRYWVDRLTYSPERDKYIMLHVKGPDEYCSITSNSVYTNMLLQHNMQLALDTLALMGEKYPEKLNKLTEKICLKTEEMIKWKDIISKIQINYDPEKKLYIQDDNFLQKEPFDLKLFEGRTKPLISFIPYNMLQRMQVLRQSDVVLLQYLLSDKFTPEEKLVAYNFYEPKTSHDSSLSLNTHGIMAAELKLKEKAYSYFTQSARMAIDDELNTVSSGLPAANLGGTWQIVVMGYGGLRLLHGDLHINPYPPEEWKSYTFHFYYKSNLIQVCSDHERCTILLKTKTSTPCKIYVFDKPVELKYGEKLEVMKD